MDKKLEQRIARLEKLVYRKIKNENMNLDNLAKRIDSLLKAYKLSTHDLSAYEVKAYSNDVDVSFYWDDGYGNFTIRLNEDGSYEVEDEYYVEKFNTIQQVVDYLIQKDADNGR